MKDVAELRNADTLGLNRPAWILLAVAAVCAVVAAGRSVLAVANMGGLATDTSSGVWATLAVDLAAGDFYRPLLSEVGYGGTRYFPLHFVLQAGLIKAGLSAMAAGFTITFASVAATLAGGWVFLRRAGASHGLAIAMTALFASTTAFAYSAGTIRGDILPAALNLWGVGLCMSEGRRSWPAAVAFTLAFAAKQTIVFGVLAAITARWLASDRRAARRLAAEAAVGFAVVLLVMLVASRGRVIESFVAVASGGATLSDIFRAPLNFLERIPAYDLMTIGLGLAVLTAAPHGTWRDLPALWFLAALGVTVAVFGSPGTDDNHVLDVELAAILFVGTQIARRRVDPSLAGSALGVVSLCLTWGLYSFPLPQAQTETIQAVLKDARGGDGPLLAENPWLAIWAGERPVMMDPYLFRLLASQNETIGDDLTRKLASRAFRAVVLEHTLDDESWYNRRFGDAFRRTLPRWYELTSSRPGFYVWRAKTGGSS